MRPVSSLTVCILVAPGCCCTLGAAFIYRPAEMLLFVSRPVRPIRTLREQWALLVDQQCQTVPPSHVHAQHCARVQ